MFDLALLALATFFVWETIRFPFERFLPDVFNLSRPLHPLVVAVLPLVVLWPEWITALAVAGVVGLLVAATDKYFDTQVVQSVPTFRRNRGLPPLP